MFSQQHAIDRPHYLPYLFRPRRYLLSFSQVLPTLTRTRDSRHTAHPSPHLILPVNVHFRATASAPVLRQQKFKISSRFKLWQVEKLLRNMLKMTDRDSLFLYVDSAFAPQKDVDMKTLHKVRRGAFGRQGMGYEWGSGDCCPWRWSGRRQEGRVVATST